MAFAITVVVRNGVIPLVVLIGNSSILSISYLLSKLTRLALYLPDAAGARLFIRDDPSPHMLGPVGGGSVLALWTIALLVVAHITFSRRDT